jgi:hypothetical protein
LASFGRAGAPEEKFGGAEEDAISAALVVSLALSTNGG